MFQKVLVANRGEIAVRVIRACRDLDIPTVAVYSEADVGALHTRMADEAFPIGPPPSSESYLVNEKILEVARLSGADAIHPGYGFLAENPTFARVCTSSGLTFIGPSADSIALMGSKVASRRAVSEHGVPMVPGTTDPISSDSDALEAATRVGYPLMLKASAGGGGKGLRLVESREDLPSALRATRAEAMTAFGDDTLYVEKFLEQPRHIEIQVLADHHGHTIHLGERECTIQRRHQKVIEESPSPIMDDDLRNSMGQAALRVARAADYSNAGTVEFLLDQERNFYFLEMNTRLQVEHAVTEAVTGIDLVVEQLKIAAGEPLSLHQEDVEMRGAAIECRIYAEDPQNDFLPSPGRIAMLQVPAGPGVRDDSGIYQGWTVPLEYDPLLSKLVTWGPRRGVAIDRMKRALAEYRIDGVRNNVSFFREVLRDPAFVAGHFDTGFVDLWLEEKGAMPPAEIPPVDRDMAVLVAMVVHSRTQSQLDSARPTPSSSEWKRRGRSRGLRNHR